MSAVLRFEPEGHRYYHGVREVPGVTRIMNPISELDGIPRDLLDAAADLGHKVHTACHLFDQGVLAEQALDPVLAPYLSAWKLCCLELGVRVLASELPVYHAKLGYAGQLDKIAMIKHWDGERGLIDLKSSVSMPRTIAPQTAAYLEAEITGENSMRLSRRTPRGGVLLKPDGTYRFHPCRASDHARDFNLFTACLVIHRWRTRT